MDGSARYGITTLDELAALYAPPTERVIKKSLDHVDALGRAFIAAAPFLVLATGGARGLDCSPKGDKPGFVAVSEDGKTLLIPDRPGNNRIDGLKNIIEDPRVAVIFLVPGAGETYRVNGKARISVDPELLQRFAVSGKAPRVVIAIAVEEAFQHCPKAMIRADLWNAGKAGPPAGVPTLGHFAARSNKGLDPAAFDAEYMKRVVEELY